MSIMSDRWIRRMNIAPVACIESIGAPDDRLDLIEKDGYYFSRDYGYPVGTLDSVAQNPSFKRYTELEASRFLPMIDPFAEKQVKQKAVRLTADEGYLEKIVSYGTSSYGYDLRCSNKFKIFTNVNSTVIDPKNFDPKSFVDYEGECAIIPPNSFALASSVEYFRIPKNVLTVCLGKSTYARCGIVVNVTPFEPEWEGHVTLEFSNTTPLPAKIYANEGVAQVLFLRGDEPCDTTYKDRAGKYMNQGAEPVSPKC